MLELYAVRVPSNIDENVYKKLLKIVSLTKRERISRFVKIQDASRSLIADILARAIICRKYGLKNNEITFITNEYGKPFLNSMNNFSYNLSHSGQWIVCGIGESDIGIDIERIQPIDLDMTKHFFSEYEYQDFKLKPSESKLDYFYDLWTLKESYIKAIGTGLSTPLNSFTIRKLNSGNITFRDHNDRENQSWYFKQYNLDPYYKLSVCSKKNSFQNHFSIENTSDLFKEILTY